MRIKTQFLIQRVFRVISTMLALAVLAAAPAANAQAPSYKVIHDFTNKDGSQPEGNLVLDASGNLYGITTAGGKISSALCNNNGSSGCGTVFELSPNPNGSWTRTVLHKFQGGITDGYRPEAGLVVDGAGNLYGTTPYGGTYGEGTVFELSPTSVGGWKETVLYNFLTNAVDGIVPLAGLTLDASGNLYGTTYLSSGGQGAVFKLSPNSSGGWTETLIFNFIGATGGENPLAGIILDSAGNLYGTTVTGGSHGGGVVYELSPTSGGTWIETVLYNFTNSSDGGEPFAGLVFDSSGNLYGTTKEGGNLTGCISGCGVVFELSLNSSGGWTENVIHTFQPGISKWGYYGGGFPSTSLAFDAAGNLYGTTLFGGPSTACSGEGCGVVFKLSPNSTGGWTETALRSFDDGTNGGVLLSGITVGPTGTLFGTAYDGGNNSNCSSYGCGVVFEITP
ncbi:MAG TPA: choice-of-anchor tandem repeat GloVer-containing protein [Candidatus Acidoferrum sp.]|nr:choice-of-anchor tandem repeat GloVer-containing protein [Candidatus Acidoferrum sp.]